MPDGPAAVPATVRSMALAFRPPSGEEWRTAMIDIPVFIVKDPESFYELLLAARPDPATGQPDPAKMKDFLAHHPETGRALQTVQSSPFSSGFANASYNSLDAFRFVNGAGASTPVRWSMAALDVGMLTINRIEGEAPGNCRDVNFDPLVLPSGIEPSEDPLLSTRSAAYSESFTRRAGEKKEPSAVQTPDRGKGV
jgi:catalase